MKKYVLSLVLVGIFSSTNANAQQASYYEEVRALGVIAGQGMACKAEKYETFEMLARAILITKANSDAMQEQGMRIYNEEKANTYISKQFDGFYECRSIANRFNNQDIFNMSLYGDGTIKMPDGQIFTPRTPYDATLVYSKNNNDLENAKSIYDGGGKVRANKADIKVEGIDSDRTKIQQPVYDNSNSTLNANPKPKPAPESSVGRISRKKR